MYTSFNLLVVMQKHVKSITSPSENDRVYSAVFRNVWMMLRDLLSRSAMTRNEDLLAEVQNPLQSPDAEFVYPITLYFQLFLISNHR